MNERPQEKTKGLFSEPCVEGGEFIPQLNPRVASACLNCGESHHGKVKRTFLGFQRIACDACGYKSLYPLTKAYVVIYWVAIVLITGACIQLLLNGTIPFPGLLFFAGMYSLWRDRQMCQNIVNNPPSLHRHRSRAS